MIVSIPDRCTLTYFRFQLEGARSKPRILHRNFLLPFIGLPTYEEDGHLEPVVSPETVEEVNKLDKIQSINANLNSLSYQDSEAAFDGDTPEISHWSSSEKVMRL